MFRDVVVENLRVEEMRAERNFDSGKGVLQDRLHVGLTFWLRNLLCWGEGTFYDDARLREIVCHCSSPG